MPDYPHILQYYADKQRAIDYGGSANEQNIRPAFLNCLTAYCRAHRENLELVPELSLASGVRPDGTVKDKMRLTHGYWEAKDLHDNLEAEIQAKFARGYPQDNILFENSRRAILIQRGIVAMQVDMGDPAQLHRLIAAFLNFVTREVEEFRQAWQQFKKDLPDILAALREAVRRAAAIDDYQAAAGRFLELCHRTISPAVSQFDVEEMLFQHLLTRGIFLRVFGEEQFHQENNIARQLDALAQTFFTGSLRRETIDELLPYYGAITAAAANIGDYREKQRFLKVIYEDFYQAYNPAAADRLGVVYTPDEIVDFIIRGADHLLQRHFGRSLADDNVQILDPATGTGTFVTSLIDYLPDNRLEYKYLNEIHANELAILPYYIANLNIEYSYREKAGRYREFPNLCFVDTLDNLGWKGAIGATVQRQPELMLGGLSQENWNRVEGQNDKPISVILGNPPYNSGQNNWNELNPNRAYPEIDSRIAETYVAASKAQKTQQYDMYKRFIRWASDRLDDDGVIGFITNRAYIDSFQDDGFRKVVMDEFSEVYIVDLGGNFQKGSGRGNIFGIKIGVAIAFMVRRAAASGKGSLYYHAIEDKQTGDDKLALLKMLDVKSMAFEEITPDAQNYWLNQSNPRFGSLLPMVNRKGGLPESENNPASVFDLHCPGVMTGRDEWVYDYDKRNLADKARHFIRSYNALLDAGDESYPPVIKWSSTLRDLFRRGQRLTFNSESLIQSLYRPFVVKHYFASSAMSDRLTRNHYEIFGANLKQPNTVICINGPASNHFSVLATDKIIEKKCTGTNNSITFCLPRYRYTAAGERVSNITDWAVQRINEHFRREWGASFDEEAGPDGITADHIFAYAYAVLHDPVYRHDYAVDLRREFPRLPLYHEFMDWARMGRQLLDLHLNFEAAEPYPLRRAESAGAPSRILLRADKAAGVIRLDDKTQLTGVPAAAWRYQLGPRSALEWALDQYKERPPRDATIAAKFNAYRYAHHQEQLIQLLQRLCTVSLQTMDIVDSMAYWEDGALIVYDDRDRHEWAMLGLQAMFSEDEDPEWLAAWQEGAEWPAKS